MTVGELVALLDGFPPDLPVYFSPDPAGRVAVGAADAVVNLVNPARHEVIGDDDTSVTIPNGFTDAVVIYPRSVNGGR